MASILVDKNFICDVLCMCVATHGFYLVFSPVPSHLIENIFYCIITINTSGPKQNEKNN
jgi:hypothetical protein